MPSSLAESIKKAADELPLDKKLVVDRVACCLEGRFPLSSSRHEHEHISMTGYDTTARVQCRSRLLAQGCCAFRHVDAEERVNLPKVVHAK